MKLATVILVAFLISACSGRTVRGDSAPDQSVTTQLSGTTSPATDVADQVAIAPDDDAPADERGPDLDLELADLDRILSDLDRAMTELSEEFANNEGEITP